MNLRSCLNKLKINSCFQLNWKFRIGDEKLNLMGSNIRNRLIKNLMYIKITKLWCMNFWRMNIVKYVNCWLNNKASYHWKKCKEIDCSHGMITSLKTWSIEHCYFIDKIQIAIWQINFIHLLIWSLKYIYKNFSNNEESSNNKAHQIIEIHLKNI